MVTRSTFAAAVLGVAAWVSPAPLARGGTADLLGPAAVVAASWPPGAWGTSQIYTVEPIPSRGRIGPRLPQQEAVVRGAAEVIARSRPVPADRIRFYGWMDRDDAPVRFAGWGVFVVSAAQTDDGWRITLWVTPFATRLGASAFVYNRFVEEYDWSERDGLRFVRGGPDPNSGSEPSYGW